MEDLTEKKLDSEQLIDGKLLKVYRDTVQLPDDKEAVREWIDHPGASAIVPLFEDGTTLLLRQFRYAVGETLLEVPAGKIDHPGEDPETVAARELEEETGWRADQFTHLGALYPAIGYSNELIHFFLAEELSPGERSLEDGEFVESVTIGFEEAVEKARQGEILDVKSFSVLLLAAQHLKERQEELQGKELR